VQATVFGGLRVGALTDAEIGSRKARTLLAVLLLACGAPVRADQLIDVLWRDAPPERPAEQLGVLVSRLRRLHGPDAVQRTDGYATSLVAVDLTEFEARTADAQARLAAGEVGAALASARAGLELADAGPLAAVDAARRGGPVARLLSRVELQPLDSGTMVWHQHERHGLLTARIALAAGDRAGAAGAATEVWASAAGRGSIRHELVAWLLAACAVAGADSSSDDSAGRAAVTDLLTRLDRTSGLEAWRWTALAAQHLGVDRWWALAERQVEVWPGGPASTRQPCGDSPGAGWTPCGERARVTVRQAGAMTSTVGK
jgi:hypothetical protein